MLSKKLLIPLLSLLMLSCTTNTNPVNNSNNSNSSNNNSQNNNSNSNTSSEVSITKTVLVSGLDTAWAIDFSKDGRMFVTERAGRIRVLKDNKLEPEPWMTLDVLENGEGGLLGLALDPDFNNNKYIYVAYTYQGSDGNAYNKLVRLKEENNKGVFDKVLIENVPGSSNHNGGRVKIGPDGKLYWSVGEKYQVELAQDKSSLNGKILRLNTDGSIPSDNPFPNSYVYSYGHRNVQGLAWDTANNAFYATEHGPSGSQGCCKDEVNLIEAGKNYGWPTITGDTRAEGLETPIANSGGSKTWAPGGAVFVNSGKWSGSLLFTGLRGESLYKVNFTNQSKNTVSNIEEYFVKEYGRLRDIAQGPDGNFYLLTSNLDGRGTPSEDGDKIIRFSL